MCVRVCAQRIASLHIGISLDFTCFDLTSLPFTLTQVQLSTYWMMHMIVCIASMCAQVCVVEAAVLLRAGWESMIDEVWLVAVQRRTALRRLMERNGLDEVRVYCP